MNIGVSTSVIQRGKTGVAQYVFSLVKALSRYSTDHQFILFVLEEDLPLFAFAEPFAKIIPVSENFRPPLKNILWHQTQLPALVKKHRIDVLHVPSYRRLLWRKPCALVSTIHDLAPFHVANKYDWKRMLYGRVIVKHLARRQDEIIAISENTAADIGRFFGTPREKISVVYNGLEHERFFPDSQTTAKKRFANQHGINAPFFLYLARLEHPAKNHVRLIEAFDQFKAATKSNWHLVFGGSDWNGAEMIHEKAARSPFSKDIHSLGFVATEDLPRLYRAADVFVYPSLYEGFGLPPIEAMACGCPVISSARGSLGEVVGKAAAIIDPEKINDMKVQLEILASDQERRDTLRVAGFHRARFFNWGKTAEETFKVYTRAYQNWQSSSSRQVPISIPATAAKS
ncbi:MAG: glycosyltransferase family 1 protein [Verrucomicrobiota bacterium]